jgi:hypothetical protein
LPQVTAGAKASLGALCILERRAADEDVAIDSLEPADALAAVLHHAYEFSPGPAERRIRMVRRYLDVCAEVPVFRLRFPPGLERLSGLLDAIEDIVVRAGA